MAAPLKLTPPPLFIPMVTGRDVSQYVLRNDAQDYDLYPIAMDGDGGPSEWPEGFGMDGFGDMGDEKSEKKALYAAKLAEQEQQRRQLHEQRRQVVEQKRASQNQQKALRLQAHAERRSALKDKRVKDQIAKHTALAARRSAALEKHAQKKAAMQGMYGISGMGEAFIPEPYPMNMNGYLANMTVDQARFAQPELNGMYGLGAPTESVKSETPNPINNSTIYTVLGVSVLAIAGSIALWGIMGKKK